MEPAVLPIRLQPASLRPIAYRVLSKKHGLNIKSEALGALADYMGPTFGMEWKSTRAQQFLESVARLWKEQDRGLFIDDEGLREIIREIELVNNKALKQKQLAQASQASQEHPGSQGSQQDEDVDMGHTPPTSVTPPPLAESINWRDYFKLINTNDLPKFEYNHSKKHFELLSHDPATNNKFGRVSVKSNIKLFQQRYHLIKDRILRNETFLENKQNLIQIKNLLGRNNQRFLIFGMLTLFNDEWYLQDLTDKIVIKFDQIDIQLNSYFVSGTFVIIDGIYLNNKLYCLTMVQPPSEKRSECLEVYNNTDFLNIYSNFKIDANLNNRLGLLEHELNHTIINLGCNCYLNDLKYLNALNKFFAMLSDEIDSNENAELEGEPISIIFNGSFSSRSVSFIEYKRGFDELAKILENYGKLCQNLTLIFIPGENDHWESNIWPKQPISKIFGNRLNRMVSNIHWGSNPVRLNYLSQEFVILRDDLNLKFKGNLVDFQFKLKEDANEISRIEHSEIDDSKKLVKTLLDQGHLFPFTRNLKQVNWELDYSLYLNPIPNVLIINDSSLPFFELTYNSCKCFNSGELIIRNKFNFVKYVPKSRRVIPKMMNV